MPFFRLSRRKKGHLNFKDKQKISTVITSQNGKNFKKRRKKKTVMKTKKKKTTPKKELWNRQSV